MDRKTFGNWQYEKILGSGAFGQVELWKEKYTNKRIAIKRCMLPKLPPKQMERWKKEIEHMEIFNHPNIVRAEKVPPEMISQKQDILCMEYCNKGDLRKVLNQPENACGLTLNEVLSVMKDISSALKYLHYKNITHRDLKPENIILHEKDNMVMYKIIDLGYAKELGNTTTSASLVGTLNYVAPELFWKTKYTNSVDYWSLGILFFEVLTGYKPFVPYTENLTKWIQLMKKKKYDQICAMELDHDIEFYDHIIYPHDFTEDIMYQITDWFQVVLQWDPRQRGKHPESDDVIVFPLLQKMFPRQILFIFSVSQYRLDKYSVNNNSTLLELQQWIEHNISIPISEQIIADSSGNAISKIQNPGTVLLKNIKDSTLYVYKNDSLQLNDSDGTKLPKIIDHMIINARLIKNRSLLRQCYTALIYVMRNEIALFKHYMFALGVKLDMINTKFNILTKNIEKSLPNAESLLNEANTELQLINPCSTSKDVFESMQKLLEKIKTICDTIKGVKIMTEDTEQFIKQIKEFFDSGKLLNSLGYYSEHFENFLKMFLIFETEKTSSSDYIIEQVNVLTDIYNQFEEQKEMLLQDAELVEVVRQLTFLEKNLLDHSEIINSSMELIPSYRNKLSESKVETNTNFIFTSTVPVVESNNSVNSMPDVSLKEIINDDTEIKDNIALRALLDRTIQDIQQNWSKIVL